MDEPTSGLDPLMQQRFLELIEEERHRGATILMSSHMFPEVERVCDRVGIIKDGRLVAVQDVKNLREVQRRVFAVEVGTESDVGKLVAAGCQIVGRRQNQVEIEVQGNYGEFVSALAQCDIRDLNVHQLNLEEVFMHFYGTGEAR